jgi:hypothetical protein
MPDALRVGYICSDHFAEGGSSRNQVWVAAGASPHRLLRRGKRILTASVEVLEGEWERTSWSKLPVGGGLAVESARLGSRTTLVKMGRRAPGRAAHYQRRRSPRAGLWRPAERKGRIGSSGIYGW